MKQRLRFLIAALVAGSAVLLGQTSPTAAEHPANQPKQDENAQEKVEDTAVCAVLANPPSFNNKLVRVRGHFSGDFEYSNLTGDGCTGALWFTYGGGGVPPGLAIYSRGKAKPGSEDSQGRSIPPIPVDLIRDSRFERFEQQTRAMTKQDVDGSLGLCVTATFIGRIDAVSAQLHEVWKKTPDRAEGAGFGTRGLFEAQFVLGSVVDDAKLSVCNPDAGPVTSRPSESNNPAK